MGITGYAIMFLSLLAALAVACFININEIDKQIDNVIAEKKRQNKRIDILEMRDNSKKNNNDLFEKW